MPPPLDDHEPPAFDAGGGPGRKGKDRKLTYLAIAIGAVGVVVTIVLARRKSASNAAAAGAAGTDPTTGMPYTYPMVPTSSAPDASSGAISQLGTGLNELWNAQQQSSQSFADLLTKQTDASNAMGAQLQQALNDQAAQQQSALAGLQQAMTSGLAQLRGDAHASGASPPDQNAYYALSPAAAAGLLGSGQVGYQSGAEAIGWATAHGASTAGIDPSGYYGLSPTAARALLASGQPLYQSGAEASAWAAAHPAA